MRHGKVAPRIYAIPAAGAPVVAVFRRGPSEWAQVGRWDLAAGRFESGAWLHARLFPRRSDLSPDGRYLACFIHDPGATWAHGDAYVAISRLPWLKALHAFGTDGTWTRGYHFTEDAVQDDSAGLKLPMPYGLRPYAAVQFAVERRRGWVETPDCPPRVAGDVWDERRNARLEKAQPGGPLRLRVERGRWGGQAVDGLRARYALVWDGAVQPLEELQWADWDGEGRLLAATRTGRLQIRALGEGRTETLFEADLSVLEPEPRAAPDWAGRW